MVVILITLFLEYILALGVAISCLIAVCAIVMYYILRQRRRSPPPTDYEFDESKLVFSTELGKGNFGIVWKATAHGISPGINETTVAVKTLIDSYDMQVLFCE